MHPQPDDIEQEAAPTVLPVVGALVAAVAAASLALWPDITAVALARVTGVALVGLGLLRGYESVRSPTSGPLGVAAAAGVVGAGVALLAWPESTLLVATVLAGVWLIADGLGRVFGTVVETSVRDEVIGNLLGITESIVGVLVIARPVAGARAAALLVAGGLVLHALGRVLDAWSERRHTVN